MRVGTTLETERLLLRPVAASDVDALHALYGDPYVRRYLFDDLAPAWGRVAEIVATSERSFAERGFGHFAIAPRTEPADAAPLVGSCGLLADGDAVELLYALAPAFWRRGLALEAARAVLAFGFASVGLARVVAFTDVPNHASARVLERLGMRFLGERAPKGVPLLHYAVSREEFEAARSGRA